MPVYITANTVSEGFCLIVSIFCLYRDKETAWRLFIPFMLTTVLVEVGGIYIRTALSRPNFGIYNGFLLVECLMQNYFFYQLYKAYHNTKKLLIGWLIIFFGFALAELIRNHFGAYLSSASTLLSVELILASVYFYYLLLKEAGAKKLSTYAPFWWVNGTICFYFAGIVSNLFFSYLIQDKTHTISQTARYIVFVVLNVILYLNWSYAFICRYRQRTSST